MKTIIEGKNLRTTYEVKSHKNEDGVFTGKPEITTIQELLGWTEIKTFDEAINFNPIKLDEDTVVYQVEKSFRVDLGVILMRVDTVVSNEEINKAESEEGLAGLLKEYNKQKINEDSRMVAYCKLHNLDLENVDYDTLKDVLGNNKPVKIAYDFPSVDWSFTLQNPSISALKTR
jgi:hypothetical protein